MKDVAKWLLDNNKILEEFLDKGIHLHQWTADLEYEQKLARGLDGVFKIDFICPVHKEVDSYEDSYEYCEIGLEFWLIRHNPVFLRHTYYPNEEPTDGIALLDEEDFIHLESKDNSEEIKEAKELIYRRLKEAAEQ